MEISPGLSINYLYLFRIYEKHEESQVLARTEPENDRVNHPPDFRYLRLYQREVCCCSGWWKNNNLYFG